MKKSNLWLMALLVVGIGIGFASCKEDELTEEEKQQQADQELAEALEWWDVVSQLTDVQSLPDNWQTATFEPAVGKALESDPYTRVVSTNDLATAAQRFAYLTGAGVDETTSSYTWSHKDAGSLTYHAGSPSGTCLAQVDVNLRQMPKLKKILYQTPDQMGDNASGSFSGTAYYRFGDVVSKKNADGTGYDVWVCVRPAFSLEGKGDSHWISLSDLPAQNIYSYTSEKESKTWKVPTALGESKEHMQNLAELTCALLDPDQYFANLADPKVKTFHDFGRERFNKYHNKAFWHRVSRAWDEQHLFQTVFNNNDLDKAQLAELIKTDGLTFIYKGYSWMWGWNCTLWQANYKGTNLKTASYTSTKKDMRTVDFDVSQYYYDPDRYSRSFFGDDKRRFIVRYATGEELSKDANGKGSYSVKQKLLDCEDMYVYNRYFYPEGYDLGSEPEVTPDEAALGKSIGEVTNDDIGKLVGQDGRIYDSKASAERAGTKGVAMIVDTYRTNYDFVSSTEHTNQRWESRNGITPKGGIAIALEDGNLDSENSWLKSEDVTVSDYDASWNSTHRVNGATWRVPGIYLWQRLMCHDGYQRFLTWTYINDELDNIELYGQKLPQMKSLMDLLTKEGAGLRNNGCYLIAGGALNLVDIISMKVQNGNVSIQTEKPTHCRYVLTW